MRYLAQQYITESAKKFPNRLAIEMEGERVTYREFEERTNKLARFLKKNGVARGDRVAFCLPKSIASFEAIGAILKADAVYVPLDSHAPSGRLKEIAADAEPRIVITNGSTRIRAGEVKKSSGCDFEILDLDEKKDAIAKMGSEALLCENIGQDLAYIFYTSGSTGKPKGVMITHANIIDATEWAVDEFGITEKDRISNHPPLHFDLSTFDVYTAWKAGAALFPVPDALSLFPADLLRFIEKNKLTIWDSVPSVMIYLSRAGLVKKGRLKTVKKIFFNGEGFVAKFLREWMKAFPGKEFVNMYGPTEATVQCAFFRLEKLPAGDDFPPIGKACGNTEIFALKENGEKAGRGEEGELCIRGLGVSLGYWRNKERTERSFVRNPFNPHFDEKIYKTGDLVRLEKDGNFRFLGRKDNQVKIMGHRIELGDVDAALAGLLYVEEVKTIAVKDPDGVAHLIAFIGMKTRKEEAEIRSDIAKKLPRYMVPEKITLSGGLPRTSTGKIDQVALRAQASIGEAVSGRRLKKHGK